MKVFTSIINGHRVLNYVYRPNYDITCHWHLISEVGERWQPELRDMAQLLANAMNADIVAMELDAKPWFADVMVPRPKLGERHDPI